MRLKKMLLRSIVVILYLSIISGPSIFAQEHKNIVNGNLIQFNDNGLWCWFQDERCIVDTVNGEVPAGLHELYWTANDIASGVYIYRMQTENFLDTMKMIYQK